MKYEFKISDEAGNVFLYDVSRSSSDEEKSLNDFILEALQISEDKRKLPFKIQCPNDLEVYPSLKMKFENYGSPLLGDKLEAMHVTWHDWITANGGNMKMYEARVFFYYVLPPVRFDY